MCIYICTHIYIYALPILLIYTHKYRVQKNWCFWTVVLEKTLESPLDCKEIQPIHPKGDQSSVFIGRTDVETETPILWPPDAKSWLNGKDPDAGRDWGQEEKGTTDEMVGWHHQHNGHGFVWTLGVGDGQGGLACCGSWGRKESDTTEQLNWTDTYIHTYMHVGKAYIYICVCVCVIRYMNMFIYLYMPCLFTYVLFIFTYKYTHTYTYNTITYTYIHICMWEEGTQEKLGEPLEI